jgi:hypothetical protein
MPRPLALALVATLLASCSRYPKVDPVYGRQVIPSQRTGSLGAIVPRDGSPPPPQYYEQGAGGQQGSVPAAPGTTGDPLAPADGFGFRGSSSRTEVPDSGTSSGWNRPGTSSSPSTGSATGIPPRATGPDDYLRKATPDSSGYGPSRYESPPAGSGAPSATPSSNFVPAAPTSGGSGFSTPGSGSVSPPPSGADTWNSGSPYRSTSYDREAGANERSSPSAGGAGSAGQYQTTASRTTGRGGVVDIMDLPSRGEMHPYETSGSGGVQPAGYAAFTAPGEASSPAPASASVSSKIDGSQDQGPYGFDPGYRWIKGHLEYSPTSRRWKLRYIPITGITDQHGGSVMLEDSPAIAQMRPGEAVMIEGQIVGEGESGSFAPLYRAERVSRLQ